MLGSLLMQVVPYAGTIVAGVAAYVFGRQTRRLRKNEENLKSKYRIPKDKTIEEVSEEAVLLDYCEGCELTHVPHNMGWTDEGPNRMGEWRCGHCRAVYRVMVCLYTATHPEKDQTPHVWFEEAKTLCDQHKIDYPTELQEWWWHEEAKVRQAESEERDRWYECVGCGDKALRPSLSYHDMPGDEFCRDCVSHFKEEDRKKEKAGRAWNKYDKVLKKKERDQAQENYVQSLDEIKRQITAVQQVPFPLVREGDFFKLEDSSGTSSRVVDELHEKLKHTNPGEDWEPCYNGMHIEEFGSPYCVRCGKRVMN